MKSKSRFITLSFLLLFARGCDFYSTSLWYFDNPSHESNPLSSILGLGWNGLIITNVIIVGLIISAFYYYTFRYSIRIPKKATKSLTEYISEIYYNEKGKFYKVFYKLPKNKKVFIAHNGYVLIRAAIVGSFLAAFHNLCLFYNVSFYDKYNRFIGWPEYVVSGLMICSMIFFTYKLWKSEYEISNGKHQIEEKSNAI